MSNRIKPTAPVPAPAEVRALITKWEAAHARLKAAYDVEEAAAEAALAAEVKAKELYDETSALEERIARAALAAVGRDPDDPESVDWTESHITLVVCGHPFCVDRVYKSERKDEDDLWHCRNIEPPHFLILE